MSATRVFLLRLLLILGCAFILASMGTAFQAKRLAEKPQEFRSQAKLSMDVQLINQELKDKEGAHSAGTTAELLESTEMSSRARERVRALSPDLHEHDVAIRATQTRSKGTIDIIATGPEPRYTRIFLDALLDEFISFRQEIREKAQGPVLHTVLNEAVALQKEMKESEAALEKARAGAGSVSASLDQVRLQARLTTLRNERDERRLAIKGMAENDDARALLQTRLSAIEHEVQDIEAQIQRQEDASSELRVLAAKFDAAKQAYDKKFEQADKLQASIETDPDSVAVMERAAPAFEIVEDWKMPIALGAGGGALLGGLIGLMMSFTLVSSAKPSQRPRGV